MTTTPPFPIPPLAQRFPSSTARRSEVTRFPGVTAGTTSTVRHLLEENDRRHHIYQKISFQHNHLPHHLLAAYALGAPSKHLEAIYAADVPIMAPLERSKEWDGGDEVLRDPPLVNRENWTSAEMLGSTKYYAAYLQFFHTETARLGPLEAFRAYVLSDEANLGSSSHKGAKPRMFLRFLAGAFHPFIHTGYGLEFKDRVVFAEGLAQAAVHDPGILAGLFPEDWIKSQSPGAGGTTLRSAQTAVSAIGDALGRVHLAPSTHSAPISFEPEPATTHRHPPDDGASLLEIYALFCASPAAAPVPYNPDSLINARMKEALRDGRAEEIRRLGGMWALEATMSEEQWERKIEEMAVFATLLACATSRPGKELRIDFFTMHCLTSSIFLPSFAKLLAPSERVLLFRAYLLVTLHLCLSRGRPHIFPATLLEHSPFPGPPRGNEPAKGKLEVVGDPSRTDGGNPWLAVIQSGMYAQDSHVIKALRSLERYSSLYGDTPAGGLIGAYKQGSDTESIPGVSQLSGDIFQRAAGMIMEQTGYVREGEKAGDWDMSALGWDATWE